MRRLIPLVLLLAQQAFGAVPAPPTTAYTRGLLITTNAAQAAAYIGAGATGNVTNTYNTVITTNLTVQNSLTVISNLYTVNGSHNTMIITNGLTLQSVKTNVLATTGTGLITNVNYGSGLTWTPSTLTLDTATAPSFNNVTVTQYVRMPWTTLTMTGTNVGQIDLATASMFRVYLGANAFFGAVANHPGTNIAQTIQIALIQDGTGTRGVTMTNSTWFLNGSGSSTNAQPTINTNANALTLLTFVTSPTNAVQLLGVPATISP